MVLLLYTKFKKWLHFLHRLLHVIPADYKLAEILLWNGLISDNLPLCISPMMRPQTRLQWISMNEVPLCQSKALGRQAISFFQKHRRCLCRSTRTCHLKSNRFWGLQARPSHRLIIGYYNLMLSVSTDFNKDLYSGEIDTLTGFALVTSFQTCFVWQHAQVCEI